LAAAHGGDGEVAPADLHPFRRTARRIRSEER
jgi:hypothetical protein